MEESIGDERSDDKGSDEYAEEAFDDDDDARPSGAARPSAGARANDDYDDDEFDDDDDVDDEGRAAARGEDVPAGIATSAYSTSR